MFELLQAYETAKNEKNKVFRFLYIKYVRHKLKSSFFKPFKYNIKSGMILEIGLLVEFAQFYNCIKLVNQRRDIPYIYGISESGNTISLQYYNYIIKYKISKDTCDIELSSLDGNAIVIHPLTNLFCLSFWAEIILMAIYNYCVSYIYGEDSKLYIDDNLYIKKIKSMYF